MAIDVSRHQNSIFRHLEEEDEKRRSTLLAKIERKSQKCNSQRDDYIRKRSVDMHKANEKVGKHLEKHLTNMRHFDEKREEKAQSLTKDMMTFHHKQLTDTEKEWRRLRSLKTCYQRAEQTIRNREHEKEMFALRSKE